MVLLQLGSAAELVYVTGWTKPRWPLATCEWRRWSGRAEMCPWANVTDWLVWDWLSCDTTVIVVPSLAEYLWCSALINGLPLRTRREHWHRFIWPSQTHVDWLLYWRGDFMCLLHEITKYVSSCLKKAMPLKTGLRLGTFRWPWSEEISSHWKADSRVRAAKRVHHELWQPQHIRTVVSSLFDLFIFDLSI